MPATEKIPASRNGVAKVLGPIVGPLIAAAFAAGGFWAVVSERVARLEEERPQMIQAMERLRSEVTELKVETSMGIAELKAEVRALRRRE